MRPEISLWHRELRFIELRYADPTYAPEWRSADDPDRPEWEAFTLPKRAAFLEYVQTQLKCLHERVYDEDWSFDLALEAKSALPQLVPQLVSTLARSEPGLSAVMALHPEMTFNELCNLEARRDERLATGRTRRGPTRGKGPPRAASAAQDIWRLHHVIFPRFWGRRTRGEPFSTAMIAAQLNGVTESAAVSWYEKHIRNTINPNLE